MADAFLSIPLLSKTEDAGLTIMTLFSTSDTYGNTTSSPRVYFPDTRILETYGNSSWKFVGYATCIDKITDFKFNGSSGRANLTLQHSENIQLQIFEADRDGVRVDLYGIEDGTPFFIPMGADLSAHLSWMTCRIDATYYGIRMSS